MSGVPRVSSLDFLAHLVCSNPMPSEQLQLQGVTGSGGGPGGGGKPPECMPAGTSGAPPGLCVCVCVCVCA